MSVYSLSSGASSVGAGVQGGGSSPRGGGDDDEEGVGDLEGRRPGGEGAERTEGRGDRADGRDGAGGGDGRYGGSGNGGRRDGIERTGSFTSPGSAARICSSTNIMAMSSPPPSATQHMPPRRTESDAGPIWI